MRRDLTDIFEEAVERLDAGESLNDILRDYPEYADPLRRLLETSQRVTPKDTDSANSRQKHKTKSHSPVSPSRYSQHSRWMTAGAALLVLLAALAVVVVQQQAIQPVTLAQTARNCEMVTRDNPYQMMQLQSQRNESDDSDDEVGEYGFPTSPDTATSSDSDDGVEAEERAETGLYFESDDVSESVAPAATAGADAADDRASSERESLPETAPLPTNTSPLVPLRAGEIDDNAKWEMYLDYRNQYMNTHSKGSVDDIDISGRRLIQIVDSSGQPVPQACVQIYRGESLVAQSRTYANGLTMFFPNQSENTRYADQLTVHATANGERTQRILDRDDYTTLTLTLPIDSAPAPQLDVLFLLDATGSMGDEIHQLQDNIMQISSQVDAQNLDVRYGLIAYRDRGDEYVTRRYDFMSDVQEFQTVLNSVQAGGGGDNPESLNQGLYEAVHQMDWQGNLRLMFLLADAPPHLDYQNDISYSVTMQDALARAIKIHTIASSNTDDPAEYIMRQISQYTMGKFIFLTYDNGTPGTPGDERPDLEVGDPKDEQGVGDYSVNQLDALVLKLILDEIALFKRDATQ